MSQKMIYHRGALKNEKPASHGGLAYKRRNFCQVLEGEEADVTGFDFRNIRK